MGSNLLADLVDPATMARMRAAAGVEAKAGSDDTIVDLPPGGLELKDEGDLGLEHKAADLKDGGAQVLDVDEETGLVTALVAVTGVEDKVKDTIEPGAFRETLKSHEPIGVWSHDDKVWVSRTESAVELMPGDPFFRGIKTMDGKPWPKEAGAVKVDTRFNLETPHGAAAFSDVKFFQGKTGWSIGYRATRAQRNMRTGARSIKELNLFEYSPVMVGAASQPLTLSVKSLADTVDPTSDRGIADLEVIASLSEDEMKAWAAARAQVGLDIDTKGMPPWLREKKPTMPGAGDRFPIENEKDLRNAIQAFGRAKDEDKPKVKAWIMKRARALGKESMIPDSWGGAKSLTPEPAPPHGEALVDAETKTGAALEVKDRVRTPAGQQRYGQPIGTVIIPGPNGSEGGAVTPERVKGILKAAAEDGTTNGEARRMLQQLASSDLDLNDDQVVRAAATALRMASYQQNDSEKEKLYVAQAKALQEAANDRRANAGAAAPTATRKRTSTKKKPPAIGASGPFSSITAGTFVDDDGNHLVVQSSGDAIWVSKDGTRRAQLSQLGAGAQLTTPDAGPKWTMKSRDSSILRKPAWTPGRKSMLDALNRRVAALGVEPLAEMPAEIKGLDLAEVTDTELLAELGLNDLGLDDETKGSRASLDRSPGSNWIEDIGGQLPGYVREVARAIERDHGYPLSKAIPIAIGRMKRWAAGEGDVTAATRGKAAAAVAQWEALKARAGKKSDAELWAAMETKTLALMGDIETAWETLIAAGALDLKALVEEAELLADDPVDPVDDDLADINLDDVAVEPTPGEEIKSLLARAHEVKTRAVADPR